MDNSLTTTIKLNMICWNLHAGIDWFGRFNLEQLISCLKALQPDLCGFQEVDRHWSARSHFCDLAQELAYGMSMYSAFSPSLASKKGSFGNLILSRYPLVKSWYQLMPDSREQRSFCCVESVVDGFKLSFLTTHLGLTANDRCSQAEQIRRFSAEIQGPLIICGDFNAESEDGAVQMLTKNFYDVARGSTFTPSGTFRQADGKIGPRIDYILTTSEFVTEQYQVISNYCSDHLLLLAKLSAGKRNGPVFYV